MKRTSLFSFGAKRLLALGVIPTVLVGLYSGSHLIQTQRESVALRHALIANSVAARIEELAAGYEMALYQVSERSPVPNDPSIDSAIREHMTGVDSVIFLDEAGVSKEAILDDESYSRTTDFIGLDFNSDATYRRARATNEPAWSGIFTSAATGEQVIGVVIPHDRGDVYATLSIAWLDGLIRHVDRPRGTEIAIVDRAGDVMFDTAPDNDDPHPSWANLRPITEGLSGRAGDYEYETINGTLLGSTSLVDDIGWIVLVAEDKQLALRHVYATWLTMAVLSSLVLIAAIAVAVNFSRRLSAPVADLIRIVDRVERRSPWVSVSPSRFVEIDSLTESITQMAGAVQARESELTASQKELAQEVDRKEKALRRLHTMTNELDAVEERERRRLAEELHDRVSQALAVARMRLRMVSEQHGSDENLEAAQELIGQAVNQSRAITAELYHPLLHELGLVAALREVCEEANGRYELTVHADYCDCARAVPDEVGAVLVRVCRELLANVVKHSGASQAWVCLACADTITLTVADDGVGVRAEAMEQSNGFGLLSLRERLHLVSGSLHVGEREGGGASISALVPLDSARE